MTPAGRPEVAFRVDRHKPFRAVSPNFQDGSFIDHYVDSSNDEETHGRSGGGKGVWWLNTNDPTTSELAALARTFRLHRLTQEDINMRESREKVEVYDDYLFVCFNSFNNDEESREYLEPIPIYVLVAADGVLSFSSRSSLHISNIRHRLSTIMQSVVSDPSFICYVLMDEVVQSLILVIRGLEAGSERIEDQIYSTRVEDLLEWGAQMEIARKRTFQATKLLVGKVDIIKRFKKRDPPLIEKKAQEDLGLLWSDIEDHLVTSISTLRHVEEILNQAQKNYLALLAVMNLERRNRTAKTMMRVTVLGLIFVPPYLVTTLFSIYVKVPGQDTPGLWWFGGIVGVLLCYVIICILLVKKLKLI